VEGKGNMERLKFEECKNCRDWSGCIVNCMDTCGKPIDALEEFNAYKTLEEQGKLLKLPVSVGSLVYEPYQFMGEGAWEIDVHKIRLEDLDKIGKSVFLTREEAEAALKELERG
jgi:hypothetical protein